MKNKRANVSVIILAVFLAAIMVTGCGKESEGGKTKVRIAYFPNITHTQALIMKEQGMLENKLGEECEVSYTSFNAGPAEVEALMAGEIDMGYIGPVPAINANVKSKGDVQIIANATNAGAVLIKSIGADIETAADLDGKTVAIPQLGNTQHLGLLNILTKNGLSPKSEGGTVDVVAVANADVQNLMDQGEIDAALVPEPWGSILQEKCGAEIVLDYDEVFLDGNYPTAVVVASKDFLQKHPDIVEKFLKAHEEATLYINENPVDMAAIVNKQIEEATGKSYDEAIIQSAFSRIQVTKELSEEAIQEFAKIGVEQGFISKLPDDSLINTEIQK
ncbi:MAG: aliphatic sulfonate ABC transporter substrate-binding protein [Lachnospiraceae bacterium]|nr:aliphatic sulfonate ABC transporter substrate-binding protein [Lachnospiraceae bacterium]